MEQGKNTIVGCGLDKLAELIAGLVKAGVTFTARVDMTTDRHWTVTLTGGY